MLSTTTARQLALTLGVLCVGLVVAVGLVWRRAVRSTLPLETALADPAVKQAVIEELVAQSPGIFDTFPDPMVGRVLQPSLVDRSVPGGVLSSNQWGMRERDYALPKPQATVRVVLLGDSYVYGPGVAPANRCGGFLERALVQRSRGAARAIECLHLGIPSWNIVAEAEFVRRQVWTLRPDLVVHVVVPNDLDDLAGVRGFGAMASASPQRPMRAGVVVRRDYPAMYLGISTENHLVRGLDHESRARYLEAARAIADVASAVEATGGRYLLVLNWMRMQPLGVQYLAASLRPEQVALLPFALYNDRSLRLGPTDGHWNQAGHEAVGAFLYGVARGRRLLPGLDLREWAAADSVATRWSDEAERELRDDREALDGPDRPRLRSAIVTAALDQTTAAQVYGGLFREGAGPYLSVVLARSGGDRLRIEGGFLDDPALDGATVSVAVEELTLERLPYRRGAPLSVDQPLPEVLRDREFLNVRLECDDFVYAAADLRTPLSLRVDRLAIER